MKDIKSELPWILLNIGGVIYAISCESVLSLFQMQRVTPMPKSPPEIRGVIDFRGQIIQLIDIRNILNLKSSQDVIGEFEVLMNESLDGHKNWIKSLETSVREGTEITVQTDPHKCAFGKWYDSYDTDGSNIIFLMAFSKFDAPHKAIHAIGIKAKELINNGDKDGALDLIERTKGTELKRMIGLFSELTVAYKDSMKEIVLVLGDNVRSISISVDEITAIEHLVEIDQDLIKETMTSSDIVTGTGKRKDGSIVLLLNDEALIKKFLDR